MSGAIDTAGLKPGFAQPIFDAQESFRRILDAMAYAGRIQRLDRLADAPNPLAPSVAAFALTLLDFETPLWLDFPATAPAASYLRFHSGTRLVTDPAAARFVIVTDVAGMPRLAAFHFGEDQYPDRSVTLVLQVPSLRDGPLTRWTGPGINGAVSQRIAGLPDWFWDDWEVNHGLYPLGVDIVFAAADEIVCLPRSIKVEV